MYVHTTGRWEPSITAWIQSRLREGDTFIDVGANIGYYTLLASQRVGASGHVVAIEPSPSLCEQLQRSLTLNSAQNVRIVQMAISDHPGSVKLFRGPPGNDDDCRLYPDSEVFPGGGLETEVPARRLVDILTKQELSTARLVKVDIENMEPALNAGLRQWLANCRSDLEFIIELYPSTLKQIGKSAKPLVDTFLESGFRMYNVDNTYRLRECLYDVVVPPEPITRSELLNGDLEFDVIFSRMDNVVINSTLSD